MIQAVNKNKIEITAVFIGMVLGVLGFMLPITSFIKVAGGLAVAVCILWKVEIGVFLVVVLTPFLQTMQLVGLIILSLFSFVIKLLLNKNYTLKNTPLDLPMVLFGGMIVYSSITSFAPRSSVFIALVYVSFLLFYMIFVNTIKNSAQLNALIVLFVFAGFIVGLYGIYQYYAGGPTTQSWIDKEMFKNIKARVYSSFDNPNVLGEYLVLLIPISIALMWAKKGWFYRLIFGGIAIIMGVCLIFTYSRGSWLGLMLALGIFAVLRDKRLVTLGIVGALMLPFALPATIINRFTSIGNLKDSSSAYRLSVWLGSLKIVKDYWPSGIGLGSDAFIKIYPRYALSGAAFALHAHNIYIQLLVETGIVGFISFLLLLFMFYKSILSSYWRTKDQFLSTIMIALCAGLAGYLFQGLVDNIWYNYRVMLTFWIVISLGMTAHKLAVNSSQFTVHDLQ
ncbi:O-antigen ligase family protein [Petroclostridium xylanilyticum]|jgi:putative inorganic carbon (HCO3(-)) transporter|uniref:O-antigen ligase family protein n=1 Tax=Petroclostridium xylanilyticum TaxID=1792311 RepID=UPI000B986E72|nr:O-antigen ligase family protein [Petroclostridium xylanilyticum]